MHIGRSENRQLADGAAEFIRGSVNPAPETLDRARWHVPGPVSNGVANPHAYRGPLEATPGIEPGYRALQALA